MVESTGFENRQGFTPFEGSNPSSSADEVRRYVITPHRCMKNKKEGAQVSPRSPLGSTIILYKLVPHSPFAVATSTYPNFL